MRWRKLAWMESSGGVEPDSEYRTTQFWGTSSQKSVMMNDPMPPPKARPPRAPTIPLSLTSLLLRTVSMHTGSGSTAADYETPRIAPLLPVPERNFEGFQDELGLSGGDRDLTVSDGGGELTPVQPIGGTPSSAAALANVRSNVANGIPRRTATSK